MSLHLHKSMEEVKKQLLTMGAMVEESIEKAGIALQQRRHKVAEEVVQKDDEVDQIELDIDDECLKTLALYQPVAEDLRFITTVLKINNDLERMADLAVNIAERARSLAESPPVQVPRQFTLMTRTIIQMVRDVLRAFIEEDAISARKVCRKDDEVDRLHRSLIADLTDAMAKEPDKISLTLQLLWASRNLERIADHATNIAEDIVYMVEGQVIRHQAWDFPEEEKPKSAWDKHPVDM